MTTRKLSPITLIITLLLTCSQVWGQPSQPDTAPLPFAGLVALAVGGAIVGANKKMKRKEDNN